MQLQKLEDTLGVQLFERTNKQVLVTEVGQDIVARARQVLREADDIKKVAKTYQDPQAGTLRLGVFPTLAPYWLPAIVPKLKVALPKLKLLLIEEKTQELTDQLKAGSLDTALLALPVDDPQLVSHALFKDPFLLAVPPNHAFAHYQQIDQSSILNQELLLLEEGHCLRDQALEICHSAGIGEQQDFRATSLETLRQMVAAGAGITLIPQSAKKANDGITYIPFAEPVPYRTIGILWRVHSARQKTIAAVLKVLAP
jgi:LysR family hydrogen peroxide-inducible transcriptional activator